MRKILSVMTLLLLFAFGCTQGTTNPVAPVNSPPAATNGGATTAGIPYADFSPSAYQQALDNHKFIYLEFSASWCPTCIAQEPRIRQAFSEMSPSDYPDLVAFKVDYDAYPDLKRQYGVVYQHTHVLVDRNGNRVYKSNDFWDVSDIKSIMKKLVNGEL